MTDRWESVRGVYDTVAVDYARLRDPMDNAASEVTVARWGQSDRVVPCVA